MVACWLAPMTSPCASGMLAPANLLPPLTIAWSPDSRLLAIGCKDLEEADVCLWDASGQLLFALKGHQGPVNSVAWSPDESHCSLSKKVDRPPVPPLEYG